MSSRDIKEKLKNLKISPKKSLGQNFLINQDLCKKIIQEALKLQPSDVLEVGPGLGALTDHLDPKITTLIEKDSDLALHWKSLGFHVLNQDALKFDFSSLAPTSSRLLLSNLPYNISSRFLIESCLQHEHAPQHMILMFQKEVAQKIRKPHNTKNFGILSIMAQSFWNIDLFSEVYPKDFYPAPKVASQVLKFEKIPSPFKSPRDIRLFLGFVKRAFSSRRKYLKNNLNLKQDPVLENLGFSDQSRAENLSPSDFIRLFCYIREHGPR